MGRASARWRRVAAAFTLPVLTGCTLVVGTGTRELATTDAGPDVMADASTNLPGETGVVPPDTGTGGHSDAGPKAEAGVAGTDAGPGSTCSPLCDDGADCESNQDCASQTCMTGKCHPPGCASGPQPCADGTPCGANTDCGSQRCVANVCAPPICAPSCPPNAECGDDSDCFSKHCNMGRCM